MSLPTSATGAATRRNANEWIRGIVFTALFGALFIAGSYLKFKIGFSTVPITLQTLAVLLAGGMLGATYGFASIAIVVALTATGLPLMGEGSGLSKLTGATAGFIWMFPVVAFLVGWASDKLFVPGKRLPAPKVVALFLCICAGALLTYVAGVPWLAHYLHMKFSVALDKGMYPFLPGDLLKAVAATLIIAALRPVVPMVRPNKRQ